MFVNRFFSFQFHSPASPIDSQCGSQSEWVLKLPVWSKSRFFFLLLLLLVWNVNVNVSNGWNLQFSFSFQFIHPTGHFFVFLLRHFVSDSMPKMKREKNMFLCYTWLNEENERTNEKQHIRFGDLMFADCGRGSVQMCSNATPCVCFSIRATQSHAFLRD